MCASGSALSGACARSSRPPGTPRRPIMGEERPLPFLRTNRRPPKPRPRGVTEIRGPYYTPIGVRQLEDILETVGDWVDTLKFAGGSFAVMPARAVRAINDLCHRYDVTV